jgi:hypothetical protein
MTGFDLKEKMSEGSHAGFFIRGSFALRTTCPAQDFGQREEEIQSHNLTGA